MTIQLADRSHIPALIRLLQQVGQVHHDIRPDIFPAGTQKYDENQLLEVLADKDRPIFVSLENGTVTGYCFCKIKRHECNACSVPRTEVYIDDLCVAESCRHHGVGKKLYEAVVAYARELGAYNVTLNVWACNENALKFYESLGLKPQKIGLETILEAHNAD